MKNFELTFFNGDDIDSVELCNSEKEYSMLIESSANKKQGQTVMIVDLKKNVLVDRVKLYEGIKMGNEKYKIGDTIAIDFKKIINNLKENGKDITASDKDYITTLNSVINKEGIIDYVGRNGIRVNFDGIIIMFKDDTGFKKSGKKIKKESITNRFVRESFDKDRNVIKELNDNMKDIDEISNSISDSVLKVITEQNNITYTTKKDTVDRLICRGLLTEDNIKKAEKEILSEGVSNNIEEKLHILDEENEYNKIGNNISLKNIMEVSNGGILKEEEELSSEDMLNGEETSQIMKGLGDEDDVKEWIENFHSKSVNYKPDTYYRVEGGGGAGYGGVGNGLYLGRDKQALINFYDLENEGLPVIEYKGNPKWLDLMDYSRFKEFEDTLSKYGIDMKNSDDVGDIVRGMGYDGIRYYDPQATGEEFVLFNTDKLKKVDKDKEKTNITEEENDDENWRYRDIDPEEERKEEERIQHELEKEEFSRNSGGVDMDKLEEKYYSPSDSYELYDSETDSFYNWSGDPLRRPKEYDRSSEGYTPFGDE